jgi:hypothetical protein
MSPTQARTECDDSQAYVVDDSTPLMDRSRFNTPNVFLQQNVTTPTLCTEALTIDQGSSS